MKLDIYTISETASLHDTLQRIDENHHGIIFVVDSNGAVTGLATDGDVRRHLIEGGSLEDAIVLCINRDFIWERETAPRELLLKRLDHKIRVIPLLDEARRLVGLISNDHMPLQSEGNVYVRSRAPVRISFGGGGSDLTHYFSKNKTGAVINAAITLYSHATLRLRDDDKIIIHSLDLGKTLSADDLPSALSRSEGFGLIQSLLRLINPSFGFELFLHSDFPMKSGLGGSAVVSAAILGCFNKFRRDQWDLHELAEIAYQAERHYSNVAGGWQDQYATVFGGFNFMEFHMDQNIVHPLRIHPDIMLELEASLVLCDTGIAHESGDVHEDQRQHMSETNIRDLVDENVGICYDMRNDLLRGKLLHFSQSMDKAWRLKQQFSNKISSPHLDKIYENAKCNGAMAGKLLGAGGGGFFLFYARPFCKNELIEHLNSSNLVVRPFRFEPQGLQAWTVREGKNYSEEKIS